MESGVHSISRLIYTLLRWTSVLPLSCPAVVLLGHTTSLFFCSDVCKAIEHSLICAERGGACMVCYHGVRRICISKLTKASNMSGQRVLCGGG